MAKYQVPAMYSYTGHIPVEAKSKAEALRIARGMNNGQIKAAINRNAPTVECDILAEKADDVEEGS
jgi:hypothetical protein